jgi:microsomal dipeptidase-like Zn-dependent dipeptidase
MRILLKVLLAAALVFVLLVAFAPPFNAERINGMNNVFPHEPYAVSEKASALHATLNVADWHADSLLWSRDLLQRSEQGQVDLPRLREGNVAVQVFDSVTRVPSKGTNLEDNPAVGDKIRLLALADDWPLNTWFSRFARAEYQVGKLFDLERRAPEQIKVVLTQADLNTVLAERAQGSQKLAAVMGTEGMHALDGELANVQGLFDAGYRIAGLTHFFDNKMGGSLHGQSDEGLTEFGRAVIKEMDRLGMIVDVAHSSYAMVEDVLALSPRPVIVSHTGVRGACDSHRNFPDALMKRIAERGGLVAIGFWDTATCGRTAGAIVDNIRYAIDLLGVDHVSLGSDFDGSVDTPIDVSEMAALTHIMLERGFSETEIRAVMGGNQIRFLQQWLPQ